MKAGCFLEKIHIQVGEAIPPVTKTLVQPLISGLN